MRISCDKCIEFPFYERNEWEEVGEREGKKEGSF
jgi:hypothetical protein